MKLEIFTFFLLLLLIPFSLSFQQLNPFLRGNPVKIELVNNHFVIATENGLYLINSADGNIENFITLSGITDFEIDDNQIIIARKTPS